MCEDKNIYDVSLDLVDKDFGEIKLKIEGKSRAYL